MKRIAAATTTALTLKLTLTTTTTTTANAFISPQPQPAFTSCQQQRQQRQGQQYQGPLQMGLFDGMKEAFSAPASMSIDSERETPIDRWMGWNVKTEETQKVAAAPENFVDAMDEKNYVYASLTKPMGIVFEENDEENGGIFVISLSEDGAAEKEGTVKPGDQLVAVNNVKVSGMAFDDALGCIVDATTEETKLTFFRGSESQLYGPTGASTEWLDEFIASSNTSSNVEA